MQDILLRELNGVGVDYTTRVTESMLARVHFIVRTDPTGPARRDRRRPAGRAARRRHPALGRRLPAGAGAQARRRAGQATCSPATPTRFPESYKDGHTPYEAMKDLAKLELLEEPGQLEMHLFRKRPPARSRADERRPVQGLPVRRADDALRRAAGAALARRPGGRRAPVRGGPADGRVYLYDFGLLLPEGHHELSEVRPHVENAFAAAWRGEAEVDGFNELVLRAGLTWRQVVVLRAYAKYLRQAGTVFSQEYMESTFIATRDRRAAGGAVRDPVRAAAEAGDEQRGSAGRASWSTRSGPRWTTWPASTRTGSCART